MTSATASSWANATNSTTTPTTTSTTTTTTPTTTTTLLTTIVTEALEEVTADFGDSYNWNTQSYLALGAVTVYAISALVVIVMVGVAWLYTSIQGRKELEKIRETIPMAKLAVDYALIPVEVIAIFAQTAGINLERLREMYRKDSMERRAIVMRVFAWNSLTKQYLSKSKFMKNGYAGESALLNEEP